MNIAFIFYSAGALCFCVFPLCQYLAFVIQGTRDYHVGESPSGSVLEVADDLGLDIKDHIAKVFDCAKDVVEYDLLVVMDKVIQLNISSFIFFSAGSRMCE